MFPIFVRLGLEFSQDVLLEIALGLVFFFSTNLQESQFKIVSQTVDLISSAMMSVQWK